MASISSLLDHLYDLRYLLLAFAVAFILRQQWNSYHRLSGFKGPFLARFTNLWLARSVGSRKMHLELYETSLKYGELARVGPNVLLTSDPELIQRMSSTKSGYTRSEWYSSHKLEVDHDNLFTTLDDKLHSTKRAKMARGFTGKDVEDLETTAEKHLLKLLDLIKRKYISTPSEYRPMDFARKASFFTMDFTTDISFGQPWGCLEKDEDVDRWFASGELLLPTFKMVSTLPWIARLISTPVIGRLLMPSDTAKTGTGRLLGVVKEVIRKRFELKEEDQKRDMMSSFIRHGMDRNDAVAEAALQIMAGTDTTATLIRIAMLHIITNPLVYTRLQSEIDDTSTQEGSIISSETARALPYLQAVIKESARICPPSTGLLSKKTPPGGDTINGKFVPGGTDIGQSIWAVMRSEKVFGADSQAFRPERWLEAEGEKLERMERSLGLVWGYGKFGCLGKGIAWMELDKIFFELLKHFDITIVDPTKPWKSENVGLWLQSEMFVRVTERTT